MKRTLPSADLSPATRTNIPGAPHPSHPALGDRAVGWNVGLSGDGLWAFAGVEDLTDKWGSPGHIVQTKGDPGERAVVYEFVLALGPAIDREKAILAALCVVKGARAAGYAWDAYGVLVSKDLNEATGFPRIQVVCGWADWTLAGDIGKINEAVNEEIVRAGLAKGIGAVRILELSEPESRYFSPQGGLGPLVVSGPSGGSLTKAATAPNPKQILKGDVQNLAAATPFTSVSLPVGGGLGEAAPWVAALVAAVLGWALVSRSRRLRCPTS